MAAMIKICNGNLLIHLVTFHTDCELLYSVMRVESPLHAHASGGNSGIQLRVMILHTSIVGQKNYISLHN